MQYFRKHWPLWSLGAVWILGVFFALSLPAPAHSQEYPPVEPNYWRGPRVAVCAEFDRTKPPTCNTNPAGVSFRDSNDCRTYRENGDGTVTILCPEDHPRYYWMIRVAAVARTCGEDGLNCIGAFFKREYDQCTYRVVPDHYPRGRFDIRVSELPYEWRILIYRQGEGRSHRDFDSQHRRQERYALYNASHPWRSQDPCRAS